MTETASRRPSRTSSAAAVFFSGHGLRGKTGLRWKVRTLAVVALLGGMLMAATAGAGPLDRIIMDLFGGPRARPARPGADKPAETRGGIDDRDSIDSRAPQNLSLQSAYRNLQQATEQKDWSLAVDLAQRLLDQSADSLQRQPDGTWVSLRLATSRLLGTFPEDVLKTYRDRNSALAAALLKEAHAHQNTFEVVQVATRFLYTSAGQEAANELALRHMDRGEFGLACGWFEELWRLKAPCTESADWRVRAALAARFSRRTDFLASLSPGLDELRPNARFGNRPLDTPSRWLERQSSQAPSGRVEVANILNTYGSPNRAGYTEFGEFVLLPTRDYPLSHSDQLNDSVHQVGEELIASGRMPLLTSQPMIVGHLAAWRDLSGVRVVDLTTGGLLWRINDGIIPEQLLVQKTEEELSGRRNRFNARGRFNGGMGDFSGDSVDHSALGSMLFREANYNTLSSDGKRLFLIQDQGIISRTMENYGWGGGESERADVLGQDWDCNRLSCYDFATGRLTWTIGGPGGTDALRLPLAGAYFHTVPVADGGELLTIYELNSELKLAALDPATGNVRWSNLIGYTDTKIQNDLGRRAISLPIATANGIIVCPTGIGWLVAIDRDQRRILWAHRYLPHNRERYGAEQGAEILPIHPLGQEWVATAPHIIQGRVIYAPPGSDDLICVDLLTGKRAWSQSRQTSIGIAGVTDDAVVCFGPSEIRALALATGEQLWQTDAPEGAKFCGCGAMGEERYLVACSDDSLLTYSLKDGRQVGRQRHGHGTAPLGNLTARGDSLLSLGLSGLQIFTSREQLASTLLNPGSNMLSSAIAQAELALAEQQPDVALEWIAKGEALVGTNTSRDEQLRLRQTAWNVAWTRVREAVEKKNAPNEADLASLEKNANRPEDEALAAAYRLEVTAKSAPPSEVAPRIHELREKFGGLLIPDARQKDLLITGETLAASLAERIYEDARPESRAAWDVFLTDEVRRLPEQSLEARAGWLAIFRFHPATVGATLALAQAEVEARQLLGAELRLLGLLERANAADLVKSYLALADLCLRLGTPQDATLWLDLAERDPRVESQKGEALTTELASLRGRVQSQLSVEQAGPATSASWSMDPQTARNFGLSWRVQVDSPLPSMQNLTGRIEVQNQRLQLSSHSPTLAWRHALFATDADGSGAPPVRALGHGLYLLYQNSLQLLSPYEKTPVWTTLIDPNPQTQAGAMVPMPLSTPHENYTSFMNDSPERIYGQFAAASPGGLVTLVRRGIEVRDPHTGELRWKLTNLPGSIQAFATDNYVYVASSDKLATYQLSDGKKVSSRWQLHDAFSTYSTWGDCLLQVERKSANTFFGVRLGQRITIKLYDPINNTTRWSTQLPHGTAWGRCIGKTWLAALPNGETKLLDITTGTLKTLPLPPQIPKATVARERYAFADEKRIYLLLTTGDFQGNRFSDSLLSIRMSGEIFAWDRTTGEFLWKQRMLNQQLAVDSIMNSPLLVFASRSWKEKADVHYSLLWIDAINKETGQIVLNRSQPFSYSGFQHLEVAPDWSRIDLLTYNVRMRLKPQPSPLPAKPSDDASAESNTPGKTAAD